jgi:hypothetical protein
MLVNGVLKTNLRNPEDLISIVHIVAVFYQPKLAVYLVPAL